MHPRPPSDGAPPGKVLRPVDIWVSCFNLCFAVSWLPLDGTGHAGLWFAAAHGFLAAAPWLLLPNRTPGRLARALREIYPVLFIGLVWSELGLRHRYIATFPHDLVVARLELALFGRHPHEVWIRAMPSPWLFGAMQGVYFAYYPLLVGIPLWALWSGRVSPLRQVVLRLAAGYLSCFLLYLLFPVEGPREALPASLAALTGNGAYAWNAGIRAIGDSLGTAFPSSHVVGGISLAFAAWEAGPRWLRPAAALLAALIPWATVYTQNHYALDAIAGVILALVVHRMLVPALARLGAGAGAVHLGSWQTRATSAVLEA